MATTPVSIRHGRTLAPMQRSLWMSQRAHPDAPVQNMANLSHIDGAVDVDRLSEAFADVVRASDVLSSRIIDDNGTPLLVGGTPDVSTAVVDVARADAHAWAEERVRRVLDPSVCAFDSVVLRHDDGTTSWYLAIHHLATDASSSARVFSQTAARYHGEPIDLSPFGPWLDTVVKDDHPRVAKAGDHWRQREAPPRIRRLYQPVRAATPEAERVDVDLDAALGERIADRFTTDYAMLTDDLSWSTFLVTATSVLLHKVGAAPEFAIGLPVHNRSARAAETVVGPLMEVFPVDVSIEPDDTLRTLHKRVGRAVMATLRHAVPGQAPKSDVETIVNVIPSFGYGSFGPLEATHTMIDSKAIDGGHLVRIQLAPTTDGPPRLFLDMNAGAADPDDRRRATEHMRRILDALVTDPDTPLAELDIRTDAERAVTAAWETAPDFPGPTPDIVSSLAGALAGRDDPAIDDGTRTRTGRELWNDVLAVASSLQQRGVERGDRVGIEIPRSIDAVVAILATLAAGGSYVPLDPAQPRHRLDELARRAGCRLVLRELPEPAAEPPTVVTPDPDDEAYLLYTSGSTGEPKGVPITHGGLARYIRFAAEAYTTPGEPPVAALFSALTFDLTVTSLFVPLVVGGRTVVIEADGGAGLTAIAQRPDITWAKATPSHLEVLVRLLPDDHRLRTLVVGGEAFGSSLARRLVQHLGDVRIFNEYGPTEAVVGCMIHESTEAERGELAEVPIGRPAPGVTLAVVDANLGRVPLGAQGELCISHVGLTAGYLGQDADAEASPFVEIDGRRWYRSGDLVRMIDDQTLVYLGRIDEQVKVGGIRLEPIEVEQALEDHPAIARAAVRLWSPAPTPPQHHCVRCGLPDNVPGVGFDEHGVCATCHSYERIAPAAESYFRTRDDLAEIAREARAARTGKHDCLHLLSGGKDSTYALYQLVELGFEPYVLTLDNGFISEGAKENVRRSVAELGIDHEFATTDAMNEIFRDSLDRYSNVCHGCYKTIYTLATNRAAELGIPVIVTGLSRGQLFETRLIPQQFSGDRFDPDAIERAVIEARKAYHRADDAPNRLLDTEVFEDDDIFDRISYVDFYRYIDVELAEMLEYLDTQAPWVRPRDTGRSTNCLINAAGIHTHVTEQGYHNYAEPYAWDVRLGHKTRNEAMAELDDQLDLDEVAQMLGEVDYVPRPRETLTAWLELDPASDAAPPPGELRSHLADLLPVHAIPAAFVTVAELPTTVNGKLDADALPAPDRVHRAGSTIHLEPESPTESLIVSAWEHVLGIEPIGVDDEFFSLGGDSLAAMQMIVLVSERCGVTVREELAFLHTTPRALARAIDAGSGTASGAAGPTARPADSPPELSEAELAMLFEHRSDPHDPRYNVARLYRIPGSVDADRLRNALEQVSQRHAPLSWTFSSPRTHLEPNAAVSFEVGSGVVDLDAARSEASRRQLEPFDLDRGPLLRAWVQPTDDGGTALLIGLHHISGDAGTFDRLWEDIETLYQGSDLPPIEVDYADFKQWQQAALTEVDKIHWLDRAADLGPPSAFQLHPPLTPSPDGYVEVDAGVTTDALRSGPGATGFATVFGALAAALRSYVDGDRVDVGIVASTQGHPSADPLVGYFLNTLPMALACRHTDSLGDLCVRAGDAIAAGLPHRGYPFARMVADHRAEGSPPPDASIMLAFEELAPASLGDAAASHVVLPSCSAVTEATFFVQVRGQEVRLGLEYRGTVFSDTTARQMIEDFQHALRRAITEPSTPLAELALPSVAAGALAGAVLPPTRPVIASVLDHVQERAHEPAVVCGDESLSWAELGARSASLAAALVRTGVSRGDRVILAVGRSVDLVAGIVATHRIGASYVPIDPTYPADRIALIASRSGATAALVDGDLDALSPRDIVVTEIGTIAFDQPDGAFSQEDEAYVIFTSGSTGEPRGVAVQHHHLAASTEARLVEYADQPGRFLVVSSAAFDSSVAGLFWALRTGSTIVLPTDAEAHDPDALLRLFAEADVTHTLMVPTLYRALLERGRDQAAWPRQCIVAGEASASALVAEHHLIRPDSRLSNEYGPTEATVWATVHHFDPGDVDVPVGPPVAGTHVAIVDADGRPVPAAVAGELVIGGAGVVGSYVDDPDRSALKFGRGSDGLPTFRTGDRAAIVDGAVRFLGRSDHQLNVGGMRAEPEDIERHILANEAVAAAVVVAADTRSLAELIEDAAPEELGVAMGRASTANDPVMALRAALREFTETPIQLVAHLETVPGATVDIAAIRRQVSAALPAGLRPVRYTVHEALPRTPNDKIDRDAAAFLEVGAEPTPVEPRRSGTEVDVAISLFRDVLGPVDVGHDDSFFELGGHSLLALKLVEHAEARTGATPTLAALYENPTPAGLAELLGATGGRSSGHNYVVPVQTGGSAPPLFGVHVLGINAEYYRPLAQAMGPDQPVYGLGIADSLADATAPTAVTEIVSMYAADLERVAPEGPVVLTAISMGSVIAVELARVLQDRGREVALVAMFDAMGPGLQSADRSQARRQAHLDQFRAGPISYVGNRARNVAMRAQRRGERLELSLRTRLGIELPDRLRVRRFIESNLSAAVAHEIHPFDGRIVVFRAQGDPSGWAEADPTFGWGAVSRGDLEIIDVPGDHTSLVADPHVSVLAAELHDAVGRALAVPAPAGRRRSRADVESELIAALHADRLAAATIELAAASDLDDAAAALVRETDATLAIIANDTKQHARTVDAALASAGVVGRTEVVPSRLVRASITASVDDPDAAIRALADLGFGLQHPMSAGAWAAYGRTASEVTLIARDRWTTRVRLVWGGQDSSSRIRRVTDPTPADLAAVGLPRFGWPAYWAIRPLRLINDRLRGRRGGGDLGVYLGTPTELAVPILDIADVGPQDMVVDVGCGDGRVVVEAARQFGCRARGIERDPALVTAAREMVAEAGLSDRVEIIEADAAEVDLADATVVFAFLPVDAAAAVLQRALRTLGPTGRVVAHEQSQTDWPVAPDISRLVVDGGISIASVWHAR